MRAVFTSIAVAIATFFATSASAEVYSCHIGKPSYCFKYGGNLCEQWNNAPGKPAAFAKWTAACLDCHNAIPTCLGNKRPLSTAPPMHKLQHQMARLHEAHRPPLLAQPSNARLITPAALQPGSDGR